MKAGDLIKDVSHWDRRRSGWKKFQLGLVLEANISPVGRVDKEKRAKILWDDGHVSSVAMWTVEVISSG